MSEDNDQELLDAARRQFIDPDSLTWMVERSPVANIVVDDQFRIEFVNAKTEFLFGYHRSELLGKSVDVLVPDAARGAHGKHTAGYAKDPRSRPMGENLDLHGKHKNGHLIPVSIVLEPKMTTSGLKVLAVVIPKEGKSG